MPKLKSSLPKYRKHRATGQAVVTLSGKDFYVGPYGTNVSKIEYDRLIAEWLANGRRLSDPSNQCCSVSELCVAFMKYAQTYYVKNGSPTSEQPAFRLILKLTRKVYGSRSVEEFTPTSLKAIRQMWISGGQVRNTINQSTRRLVHVFRWGVEQEMVPVTVYQALAAVEGLKQGRTEAKDNPPVMPVTTENIQATLSHVSQVVADMVRFQLLTGCRPEDVWRLRPCDLDQSEDVWLYRPSSHKTEHRGRERIVFIGPKAQSILEPYLDRKPDQHCFSPREATQIMREQRAEARTTPIGQGNRAGTNRKQSPKRKARDHYDTNSYRRAIHRGCTRAGLATWNPNQLRHSRGTDIRRDFGLEAAQVVLGHASADITQTYAERDLSKAMQVAREVG